MKRVNIDTLKILNELHSLGLTHEHFQQITKERKKSLPAGRKIIKITGRFMVYFDHYIGSPEMCDSHENIKEGNTLLFDAIIKCPIDDCFYRIHEMFVEEENLDLNRVVRTKKQLYDLAFSFLPDTPDRIEESREDNCFGSKNVAKEIEKRLKGTESGLKAIYSIFGEKYEPIDTSGCRLNIPTIIKVFSVPNHRVALLVDRQKFSATVQRGMFNTTKCVDRDLYFVMCLSHKDPRYDYCASGRGIVSVHHYNNTMDVWPEDGLDIPSEEIVAYGVAKLKDLDIDSRNRLREWTLMTADDYAQNKNRIMIERSSVITAEEDRQMEKVLKEKMRKAFKGGKLERHNITFTPKYFECGGVRISGPRMEEYLGQDNVLEQKKPDFYTLFSNYVNYAAKRISNYNYYSYTTKVVPSDFRIGSIKVAVKTRLVGNIQKRTEYRVNNHVILQDDISALIKSAINFSSQRDFDSYVEFTSKNCMAIQSLIKDGFIKFDMNSGMLQSSAVIHIPLKMEDGIIYAVLGDKNFAVKNKRSLLKLSEADSDYYYRRDNLEKAITQINRAFKGMTSDDIILLIRQGMKLHEEKVKNEKLVLAEKIKRSKEFLAHAMKLSKAEKVKDGYLVQGLSGKMYYVEAKDVKVYLCRKGRRAQWENSQYLCIVDKKGSRHDNTEYGKNDAIAKRLLSLSKDSVLAEDIFYEGDQIDRHWLDVAGAQEAEG